MGLCAVLLICLSQAELGRAIAQGHEDALSDSPLWTDGYLTGFHRTKRDQMTPQRETSKSTDGRGLDISTLPDNVTQVVEDSTKYYTWQSFGPTDRRTKELWVDQSALHQSQVQIHSILSNAHQRAARVALSFDFPFYGHTLRQVIVATGGFMYMGDITHRMLTATQYIAPLMANFDPGYSKNSTVRFADNGNLFVVQWDNVRLHNQADEGPFIFQAVLHRNGSIVFNYREIPMTIEKIDANGHPVKIGLSEAFMVPLQSKSPERGEQFTIYEYHRVEINFTKIVSSSAFVFTPLPTCLQHKTCDVCLTSNLTTGCGWCNTLQRCSDGIDRHRQEWLQYNCPEEAKGSCEDYNPVLPEGSMSSFNHSSPGPTPTSAVLRDHPVTRDLDTIPQNPKRITENTAIIAGVVAALVLLVALTLLAVYYINTHPTVAPPFYLMQRRTNNYWPSMKFRNQGCHSNYAEVELGGHEKEGFIEAEQCC